MPAAQNMSISDGTAPVVFTPESISSTHVVLQNLAQPRLDLRELLHFDRPAKAKDVRRSFRINYPIEVTLADGAKVVKMVTFKGEEISPADVPADARTRVRVMAANALTHVDTAKVFDNPEWMF